MPDKNKISITCVCSPSLGISRSATNESLTITKRIVHFEVYKVLHKDVYKCLEEGQMVVQGQKIFVPVNQRLPFRVKLEDDIKGDVKLKVCSGEGCKIYASTSGNDEASDFTLNCEGLRQRNLYFRAGKSGKHAICLEYEHEGKTYSKAIEVEVFEVEGAIHVPEYGKFTYKLPQLTENSRWGDSIENGTVIAQNEADKQKIKIHWQEGNKLGVINLIVNDSFKWSISINIIKITLTNPRIEVNNNPIEINRNDPSTVFIDSSDVFGIDGIKVACDILLESVINNVNNIDVGFIQNVTTSNYSLTYGEIGKLTQYYEENEDLNKVEGKRLLDTPTEYDSKFYYHSETVNNSKIEVFNSESRKKLGNRNSFTLILRDSPRFASPRYYKQGSGKAKKGDSLLTKIHIRLDFDLWVAAVPIGMGKEAIAYKSLYAAKWAFEVNDSYPLSTEGSLLNLKYPEIKVIKVQDFSKKIENAKQDAILEYPIANAIGNKQKFNDE